MKNVCEDITCGNSVGIIKDAFEIHKVDHHGHPETLLLNILSCL